jgi:hypothetical protein
VKRAISEADVAGGLHVRVGERADVVLVHGCVDAPMPSCTSTVLSIHDPQCNVLLACCVVIRRRAASTLLFSTLHVAMIMKLEADKLSHLWTNYPETQTIDSDKIALYVVLLVHQRAESHDC